jgi:hypothetical protein
MPHSIIHGDACFAYFNKIWGIPLFGRLPAFTLLPHLLHLGGGLLHEREDVLRILLGAQATTRLAGMAGDQPVR